METGKEIAQFAADGGMQTCAGAPDGRTVVAGDVIGGVHFLRLLDPG